jgi:hypothetical protein
LFSVSFSSRFALPVRAQEWRGGARLDGWIKDPSEQAIADASLKLSREVGPGPTVQTDKKGYWALMGLAGGTWNIEISAAGFETRKITVRMSEQKRVPPMELRLEKAAAAPPAASPPQLRWRMRGQRRELMRSRP